MKHLPVVATALLACAVLGYATAAALGAAPSRAPSTVGAHKLSAHGAAQVTYDVQADIDGKSDLILSGTSAYWHHIDFVVPGRQNGQNLPTLINGASWTPTWPNPGTNDFCNCNSDTFNGVSPAVPATIAAVSFVAVNCRESCTASAAKGVLTIEFNDDDPLGDAQYEIKVTVTAGQATAPTSATAPAAQPSATANAALTAANLRLRCTGASRCSGSYRIVAISPKVIVASGLYSISSGVGSAVRLKLTATARRLLKIHRTLRTTLELTPTGGKPKFDALTIVNG